MIYVARELAPQNAASDIRPAQVVIAATIGGAGSVLGGGKFANGAVTGAFSNVFNEQRPHGVKNTPDQQVNINKTSLAIDSLNFAGSTFETVAGVGIMLTGAGIAPGMLLASHGLMGMYSSAWSITSNLKGINLGGAYEFIGESIGGIHGKEIGGGVDFFTSVSGGIRGGGRALDNVQDFLGTVDGFRTIGEQGQKR